VKIAFWDIETWDLKPQFGPIICASVLLLPEEKMVTFRQDNYKRRKKATDMEDDRQICCDLRDLLNEQYIHSGWFSKGFDITHVNTRLAHHGEALLESKLHLDAVWFFKGWRGLNTMSSKMKHVAEFFGIEEKPDIKPETWLRARIGQKKAMDEVVKRCEADVRITRELTEKALELNLVKNIQRYP